MFSVKKMMLAAVCFGLAFVSAASAEIPTAPAEGTLFGISYMMPDGTISLGGYAYSNTEASALMSKEEVELLENVSGDGWSFAGWYLDPEYSVPVTRIEPGEFGEKKFYARLEKMLEYSFIQDGLEISGTLVVYGGESDSAIGAYIAEDVVPLVPLKPETDLFTFEYAGFWVVDKESGEFAPSFTKVPKKYGIEYVLPEGVVVENLPGKYECGQKTVLSEISMDGWIFRGWLDGEDTVAFIGEEEFGDRTFTAILEKIDVKSLKVVYGSGQDDFVWVDVYVTDSEERIQAKINKVVKDSSFVLNKESDNAYLYEQRGWYDIGNDVYVPKFRAIAKPVSARVVYDSESGAYVTIVIRATDTGSDIEASIAKALDGKPNPEKPSSEKYDYTFCGWNKDLVNGTFVFTPDFDSTRVVSEKKESEDAVHAPGGLNAVHFSLDGRSLEIEGLKVSRVLVLDMQGRKVMESEVSQSKSRVDFPRAGAYLVGAGSEVRRFVVK